MADGTHDRGCDKTYRPNHLGQPICVCGIIDPDWSPIIDPQEARRRRDEGMQRAEDHAKEEFKAAAYKCILKAAHNQDEFIVDLPRQLFAKHFPHLEPRETRAWGPVMLSAVRDGVIEKSGRMRNSQQKTTHANPRTIWRSKVKGINPLKR